MSNIPLISYICSILARLVYFNNNNFLDKYKDIFSLSEFKKQVLKIKTLNQTSIFNPKINNIIPISKSINKILHNKKSIYSPDSNVKYIIISTSNYSSVFVIADKSINTIFVVFRGTSSPKSGLSYSKLSSSLPYKTCVDSDNAYLLGIFKIVAEIYYTINESIHYLANDFLSSKKFKLITTGHSLGGACAQLFSYFWLKKNKSSKLTCITIGAPRVINGEVANQFEKFIKDKKLFFQRIVTNGDPITYLPPKTNKTNEDRTYFHMDEKFSLPNLVLFCSNYKTTKKINCSHKAKTVKKKLINHSSYLAISYANASQGLTDTKKEIKRDKLGNTICRIIMGGNMPQSKVSFFNLQEVKTPNLTDLQVFQKKLAKMIMMDYIHQDIYMNKKLFKQILDSNEPLQEDLNPLQFSSLISLDITHKSYDNLICI